MFWFHTSRLLNSNIIRSRCMTPKITAHYCELTWFRPWFHLVPHVGKNAKSQLTIGSWFGSWFGSTWFRSCEKECCEEPLPTMYWGSVGLMGRLRKKCLSFSHQRRKPNVNWISSLSESDRLEIQLTFVLGHCKGVGGRKYKLGCPSFFVIVNRKKTWKNVSGGARAFFFS